MGEWRLFEEGTTPHVSTLEFHAPRDRAPHLEQAGHRPRLLHAATLVAEAAATLNGASVSDLGCGDGGLLSIVQDYPGVLDAWGYDFTPANARAWGERGVEGYEQNFIYNRDLVHLGDIVVMTETLEHLADPHEFLRWLHDTEDVKFLVASSPAFENDVVRDPLHAWAWDQAGYAALVEQAGFKILRHDIVTAYQVLLAADAI